MKCRLCGVTKSSEELVIALLDVIKILTFKEFVEYYCQIKLNPQMDLSQRVCQECKMAIDKFAAFSLKVERYQISLEEPLNLHPRNTTNEDDVPSINNEIRVHESLIDISVDTAEPKPKKIYQQPPEDFFIIEQNETLGKKDKKRFKIVQALEEVGKCFDKKSLADCEAINVKTMKISKYGEVPLKWLIQFDDFETWGTLEFQCQSHCNEVFKGLSNYLTHLGVIPDSQRSLKCQICPFETISVHRTTSYINHMSRQHFSYIKFCCILCSKVFVNMSMLSLHYQKNHDSVKLVLYPCLNCGLYCQKISQLKAHKSIHDIQPNDDSKSEER